jgi:hypothetical protein
MIQRVPASTDGHLLSSTINSNTSHSLKALTTTTGPGMVTHPNQILRTEEALWYLGTYFKDGIAF